MWRQWTLSTSINTVYMYDVDTIWRYRHFNWQQFVHYKCIIYCSPLRIMVASWFGSIRLPSRHKTRVPLRFAVALNVAVDVMDVPGTTSVTLNSKGGSGITFPRPTGASVRTMLRDETTHWCEVEESVQVNVTLSPGHGLSTLDCNWAPETEKGWEANMILHCKHANIDS